MFLLRSHPMKNVMIIDDETQVLKALQRHLVRKNWRVIAFNNPETALDYAKYGVFPVVISDYRMPEMNGVDFLRQFNKTQPYSFKIMLSGQADIQAMGDAINIAEIDRFLHKPWDNKQLVQEMEQGLIAFKQNMGQLQYLKKKTMTKAEFIQWNEKLLEQMSPGITKVRRNEMGWVEVE